MVLTAILFAVQTWAAPPKPPVARKTARPKVAAPVRGGGVIPPRPAPVPPTAPAAELSAVPHAAEYQKVEDYKMNVTANLSYITWEDRVSLARLANSRVMLYTPCAGLALGFEGDGLEWNGSLCGGVGRADILFPDGTFDNHGKLNLFAGSASVLMPVSDDGTAFGLEGQFLSIDLTAASLTGKATSATMETALMGIGRYRIGRLDLKFKGGSNLNSGRAIWAFELGYAIWKN
jgi:hypothetical protein